MSIAQRISTIQTDRNTIRAKLVELGLATNTDKLTALAAAIEDIVNQGAVSVEIKAKNRNRLSLEYLYQDIRCPTK